MEIITRDHIIVIEDDEYMSSYTLSDASLDTEVVSSNHFESAASIRQRLNDVGVKFVERSIVKFGKQIGRGGQGSVYEASVSWPYMDRATKMAVKKFNSKLGISQGWYPVELLNTMQHHVVRPRAFFIDDDSSLCMLMPLYSGDLRSVIDREMAKKSGPPFAEVISFSIIMQLALGMEGLHSAGVCHRDLKAANILVSSTPIDDALVAEAGFKFMHAGHIADFENSGDVKGTAFWRAPKVLMSIRTDIPLTDEQWQAADVYSFGMVCYEIVTGEIPFVDKLFSDYDIVINGGRPELPEYVPEFLRKMIMDCWHSNPECRPDFGEILRALMRKAQEDPYLECILTAWEYMRGVMNSKSEAVLAELMQLKEILWKHCIVNDDAIVGHRNYATWGLTYVCYVDKVIEMLRREDLHWMMTFVDCIEFRKLSALLRHSCLGFISSLNIAGDTQQHNKDMKDHGPSFVVEKPMLLFLARNIHEVFQNVIQIIRLNNNDNDLTLKEKFKIVDDLVIQVRKSLDENEALELLDEIMVKLDPSGTNEEIAIFQRHMKFMVRLATFEKKYYRLLYAIIGSIVLYFIYTSPNWNYILFQVFGVVLSDSNEVYVGFMCPLMGIILYNWLVFKFSKYRIYFFVLLSILSLYISYSLFRNYGFRREFGWAGIWYCLSYGITFSIALIFRLHEYLYVKVIRLGASSTFTHRVKTREE